MTLHVGDCRWEIPALFSDSTVWKTKYPTVDGWQAWRASESSSIPSTVKQVDGPSSLSRWWGDALVPKKWNVQIQVVLADKWVGHDMIPPMTLSTFMYCKEQGSLGMPLLMLWPTGLDKSKISYHFPCWYFFGVTPKKLTWRFGIGDIA